MMAGAEQRRPLNIHQWGKKLSDLGKRGGLLENDKGGKRES